MMEKYLKLNDINVCLAIIEAMASGKIDPKAVSITDGVVATTSVTTINGRELPWNIKNMWSPEEDEIIRKNFPKMGKETADLLPARTISATVQRAYKLGVKRDAEEARIARFKTLKQLPNHIPWTAAEDDVIREKYPKLGKVTAEFLPNRTVAATVQRAFALGVKMDADEVQTVKANAQKARSDRWTEKEIEMLREEYPKHGIKATELFPGRSKNAVRMAASKLGLKRESPSTWSKTEELIMNQNYPLMGKDVSILLPGKDCKAIYQKARKMRLRVNKNAEKDSRSGLAWSREEDSYLLAAGAQAASTLRRSNESVAARAVKLGMERDMKAAKHIADGAWSAEEKAYLLAHYPYDGAKGVSQRLGRTPEECRAFARENGVKYNSKLKACM